MDSSLEILPTLCSTGFHPVPCTHARVENPCYTNAHNPIVFHVAPFQLFSDAVPRPLSQRLLSILQLTRMALVFTAISNSVCATLLLAQATAIEDGVPYTQRVDPRKM